MAFCNSCGASLASGQVFCPECGAQQSIVTQAQAAASYSQATVTPETGPDVAPKKSGNGKKVALIIAAIVAVLVIGIILILVFTKTEKEKFIGTWEGTLDYTDYLNECIAEEDDGEFDATFEASDFSFKVYYTFKEDGSYEIEADEDSYDEALDRLYDDFAKYIEDLVQEVLDQYGLSNVYTVDEYLEAAVGMTAKEYAKDILGSELSGVDVTDINTDGYYYVKDGKMCETEDKEDDDSVEFDEYETYEWVSSDSFKITGSSEDDEEVVDYPIVFTKVK